MGGRSLAEGLALGDAAKRWSSTGSLCLLLQAAWSTPAAGPNKGVPGDGTKSKSWKMKKIMGSGRTRRGRAACPAAPTLFPLQLSSGIFGFHALSLPTSPAPSPSPGPATCYTTASFLQCERILVHRPGSEEGSDMHSLAL